jgi:hypothetical protein
MPNYFNQMMNRLEGLWGDFEQQAESPLDFEWERARTRAEQSQQRKEAEQRAGAQGGMWGANVADMERGFSETRAGQEASFTNRQFEARQRALEALSSAMGMGVGLTGQMSQHQMGQLAHLRGVSDLALQQAMFEQQKKEWEDKLQLQWQQLEDEQHRWEQEYQMV